MNNKKSLWNKKGVFYLLIAVLFVAVMVFVFLAYKQYAYTDRQKVVETRIRTINDFINDIDSDSKRVIYISGFRALIALEDHVARTGQYLNDSEELFRIAFYNGTVNATEVEILENSSYSDYLGKLRLIAGKIGITIDINTTNITLFHETPWSVSVNVTNHINITDTRGLANWEFDKTHSTAVSLINIRDPVYSVYAYGRIPNTIRRSNITVEYVNNTNNDTTWLLYLINNSFYIENELAPSFLMRLEGNFSNSTHGIESLVYIPELIYQGVNYSTTKSIVDYILFTNVTGYETTACNVDNMPTWFEIDLNHTSKYEVDELSYSLCLRRPGLLRSTFSALRKTLAKNKRFLAFSRNLLKGTKHVVRMSPAFSQVLGTNEVSGRKLGQRRPGFRRK